MPVYVLKKDTSISKRLKRTIARSPIVPGAQTLVSDNTIALVGREWKLSRSVEMKGSSLQGILRLPMRASRKV